jgi:hypothetical protein
MAPLDPLSSTVLAHTELWRGYPEGVNSSVLAHRSCGLIPAQLCSRQDGLELVGALNPSLCQYRDQSMDAGHTH